MGGSPRLLAGVAIGTALLVALGACGLAGPDADDATAAPPVALPAPTATVTVTPAPTAEVVLSDQGIGGVVVDSEAVDPYPALVRSLGTPSRPLEDFCEGQMAWAQWGGLSVFLDPDGRSLFGWALRGGPLADHVRPPLEVYPGQPVSVLIERGGEPRVIEGGPGEGDFVTQIGGYLFFSDSPESDTPVWSIEMNAPGCE